MNMLSLRSRTILDSLAEKTGISAGDVLNALLERVVPCLDDQVLCEQIRQSAPKWTRLMVRDIVDVELSLGEEAAFRAKLRRFQDQSGQVLKTRKIGPGTIEVTRYQ